MSSSVFENSSTDIAKGDRLGSWRPDAQLMSGTFLAAALLWSWIWQGVGSDLSGIFTWNEVYPFRQPVQDVKTCLNKAHKMRIHHASGSHDLLGFAAVNRSPGATLGGTASHPGPLHCRGCGPPHRLTPLPKSESWRNLWHGILSY